MRSLSRKNNARKSLIRNMATSLILYERITTTNAKAKELKAVVEHLLYIAKKNDLTSRRQLLSYLFDKKAVSKVIEDLVPRYKKQNTGVVRVYKLNKRKGDGADLVILELQKGEIKLVEGKNGIDTKETSGEKVTEKKHSNGKNSKTIAKSKTDKISK
jgi:large subunit ribosomal protein L17